LSVRFELVLFLLLHNHHWIVALTANIAAL